LAGRALRAPRPLVWPRYGASSSAGPENGSRALLIGGFGVRPDRGPRTRFSFGEGIVGQAAAEGRHIVLGDVPPKFTTIDSGLSQSTPAQIVVLPILFENRVLGRSEEHTSELQSRENLVCRLL